MGNKNAYTIEIPFELKQRLEKEAKYQGTSLNLLTTYLLTTQLTQLEALASLGPKLAKKSIPDLKEKVKEVLSRVPDNPVPAWDAIEN